MRKMFLRITGIALTLAALAGCDGPRPSAPPLDDDPYYNNKREGFRFFPPEGWRQRARGEVPPGAIQAERMLVEYHAVTTELPAVLRVSVADVPESTSLTSYLEKSAAKASQWKLASPFETFVINGIPAVRADYRRSAGKQEVVKEVVAFRRGERVYFFTGLYAPTDAKTRKDVRRAVDSIVW